MDFLPISGKRNCVVPHGLEGCVCVVFKRLPLDLKKLVKAFRINSGFLPGSQKKKKTKQNKKQKNKTKWGSQELTEAFNIQQV